MTIVETYETEIKKKRETVNLAMLMGEIYLKKKTVKTMLIVKV